MKDFLMAQEDVNGDTRTLCKWYERMLLSTTDTFSGNVFFNMGHEQFA